MGESPGSLGEAQGRRGPLPRKALRVGTEPTLPGPQASCAGKGSWPRPRTPFGKESILGGFEVHGHVGFSVGATERPPGGDAPF